MKETREIWWKNRKFILQFLCSFLSLSLLACQRTKTEWGWKIVHRRNTISDNIKLNERSGTKLLSITWNLRLFKVGSQGLTYLAQVIMNRPGQRQQQQRRSSWKAENWLKDGYNLPAQSNGSLRRGGCGFLFCNSLIRDWILPLYYIILVIGKPPFFNFKLVKFYF